MLTMSCVLYKATVLKLALSAALTLVRRQISPYRLMSRLTRHLGCLQLALVS